MSANLMVMAWSYTTLHTMLQGPHALSSVQRILLIWLEKEMCILDTYYLEKKTLIFEAAIGPHHSPYIWSTTKKNKKEWKRDKKVEEKLYILKREKKISTGHGDMFFSFYVFLCFFFWKKKCICFVFLAIIFFW